MMNFSVQERGEFLESFPQEVFDLVVIGGGITGAGILLDAQSRGLKAALVEMQDFAAGTSSRSTKLIHGGLRYLKNMEFKLVAEVGRERAIVFENGPHVTKAEPMLLPIVKNGSLTKFTAGLGVWAYDILAGVKKKEKRRMLSSDDTLKSEPLLKKDIVTGGVLYYEYRTDDSRLTIEVLKKAIELGGRAVNYVKAEGFLYDNKKVSGVKLKDLLTDRVYTIKAKSIVNATGPWVDKVLSMDDAKKAGRLFVTKGVHLVVDYAKLPVKQSAYFDVGDGRMIFVIPREGKTYIGTTDTPYTSDFENPVIDNNDREYLIKAVNGVFQGVSLKVEDIESSWCGLRPLIKEEGKSASQISRKDEIFVNDSGLISIAGGKLTGYRKMSQKIVDLVGKKLKKEWNMSIPDCKTESMKLSGGDFGGSTKFKSFIQSSVPIGVKAGLSESDAEYIVKHYGSNANELYAIAERSREEANAAGIPLRLFAQLIYSIAKESVISPSDFFIRRAGYLYFHMHELIQSKEAVIKFMKVKLKWSDLLEVRFREDLDKQIKIATMK